MYANDVSTHKCTSSACYGKGRELLGTSKYFTHVLRVQSQTEEQKFCSSAVSRIKSLSLCPVSLCQVSFCAVSLCPVSRESVFCKFAPSKSVSFKCLFCQFVSGGSMDCESVSYEYASCEYVSCGSVSCSLVSISPVSLYPVVLCPVSVYPMSCN